MNVFNKKGLVLFVALILMVVAWNRGFQEGQLQGCVQTYKNIYEGLNLKKVDEKALRQGCQKYDQ